MAGLAETRSEIWNYWAKWKKGQFEPIGRNTAAPERADLPTSSPAAYRRAPKAIVLAATTKSRAARRPLALIRGILDSSIGTLTGGCAYLYLRRSVSSDRRRRRVDSVFV